MTHYIAMAGVHGCLPNSSQHYNTLEGAISGLIDTLDYEGEAAKDIAQLLREYRYVSNDTWFGVEYIEIVECVCDNPSVHDDYPELEIE